MSSKKDAGEGDRGMPWDDLEAARRWAVARLVPVAEKPHLEAEILLATLLDWNRARLLAHLDAPIPETLATTFRTWVLRRATGEPLPYITGRIEFCALEFAVTPAVLIPRPETELLVEMALEHADVTPSAPPIIADVGTGSGCIVITLASRLPQAQCYAIDLSPAAMEVARQNAARYGVLERLHFLEGDLLAPLPEPADIIVSNPPYIADTEWDNLPVSVRHEPAMALLAGCDGLNAVRRLLAQAPAKMRPGGILLVEIGERQGAVVLALAQQVFTHAECRIRTDLAGKDRVLQIRLP
ncbi:MAG: peptide chain release factor N(5)-glutamine methyltransferase [Anaerolineae bacterium]|nr:peptide chain release factor N(5)-glutamine methyltransferase [Anaerolineae bacterium]